MLNNKIKISILTLICCYSNVSAENISLGVMNIILTRTIERGPTWEKPIIIEQKTAIPYKFYCPVIGPVYMERTSMFSVDTTTREVEMLGLFNPDKMKFEQENNNKICLQHKSGWTDEGPDGDVRSTESTFFYTEKTPQSFVRTLRTNVPVKKTYFDYNLSKAVTLRYNCGYITRTIGTPESYIDFKKRPFNLINFLRGFLKKLTTPDPSKVKREKRTYPRSGSNGVRS